jgi:hypothetical protein
VLANPIHDVRVYPTVLVFAGMAAVADANLLRALRADLLLLTDPTSA